MNGPTAAFWQDKFDSGTTPWDRGGPGPQLIAWLGHEVAAGDRIVVPGCGAGWDVEALAAFGVEATGVDYVAAAVGRARALLAARDRSATIVQADVLDWEPSHPVDAVYEQTCLCALHPDHWTAYAAQVHRWLKPGGKLLAMFMQGRRPRADEGFVTGPPYHCDIHAMRALFPSSLWDWPAPPYPLTPHPNFSGELGVVLTRR